MHSLSHIWNIASLSGVQLKQRWLKNWKFHKKKAVRIVAGSTYNSHTDPIFTQLNQLKIKHLHELACGKLAQAKIWGQLPEGLNDVYRIQEDTRYATRATIEQHLLYIPTPRTEQVKRLPAYQVPYIFNNKIFPVVGMPEKQVITTVVQKYSNKILSEYETFKCTKPLKCHSCQAQANHQKLANEQQAARDKEKEQAYQQYLDDQEQENQPTQYNSIIDEVFKTS